jgi:hypothetical protein
MNTTTTITTASAARTDGVAGPGRRIGANAGLAVRMMAAELLKLRKRRGLMIWSAVLFAAPPAAALGIGGIRHAADPRHYAPAGGMIGLSHAMMLVLYMGGVAAVMIGTAAGGGDAAAGVFRDLVSTGRSRLALFAVRLPAALAVSLLLCEAAFAVGAAGSVLLAGPGQAPAASVLLSTDVALAAAVAVTAVLAVGLSSLLTSRSLAIGLLLCWNLAASRVLEHATSFGALRVLLPGAAVERLTPLPVIGQWLVPMSVGTACAVLLAWVVVFSVAGAWRTIRRDA